MITPVVCSRAGEILRASRSLEQFLDGLRKEGFEVKEVTPTTQ